MFESDFCNVTYTIDQNAVFCRWKKFCSDHNYREPLEYGLELIFKYNATSWITDTTDGFESTNEDTQWLLENFIPKAIHSSCKNIYFIIRDDSPLKSEIDGQTISLAEFFNVKQVSAIEHIKFLQETEIIDYSHPDIQALAAELSTNCKTDVEIAKNCFEYVRDHIRHSGDHKDDVTTCKASDILKYKTGWCYAKSHLLAALLRANGIPTGFCYQRLSCGEYKDDIYCLHGLNAVYLREYGWYKMDARGNKEGVDAQFDPPNEKLAFALGENEYDLPDIYAEPLNVVVEALQTHTTYDEMINHFPDITQEDNL